MKLKRTTQQHLVNVVRELDDLFVSMNTVYLSRLAYLSRFVERTNVLEAHLELNPVTKERSGKTQEKVVQDHGRYEAGKDSH